ncbi:diacylglycerol/lipid kinase family protein [Salmonirosea aquatica]|uniref:Diacylglycerol kinase n=1 Tax=Salmonirosea aquatica TaxID=2654236 RepID=A0A7C9FF55_9BACT|nr:diacylglycerol kinase [Cytophagaceae bacterium SJW1-29]
MPFPKKVLLVVNPIAGDVDKTELIENIESKAKSQGFDLAVYRTDGENDRQAIEQSLQDFQPDRVLVAGGDGTINQIADILQGKPVTMGLLPLGSANGLATNLGISGDWQESVEVALGEHISCLDGMMINGHLGLHLSDLGLNARLVKNYEEGEVRGKWGYAKEVIRTLSEHDLFRVRITTDTETVETDATIVILANATMYGTGVVINPEGNLCDGKFEVIVATRFDIIELAKLIAGATELDPEVVRTFCTTHAEIECLEQQALFQIDGEFMGPVDRVKAHILPNMLSVAVPAVTEGVK